MHNKRRHGRRPARSSEESKTQPSSSSKTVDRARESSRKQTLSARASNTRHERSNTRHNDEQTEQLASVLTLSLQHASQTIDSHQPPKPEQGTLKLTQIGVLLFLGSDLLQGSAAEVDAADSNSKSDQGSSAEAASRTQLTAEDEDVDIMGMNERISITSSLLKHGRSNDDPGYVLSSSKEIFVRANVQSRFHQGGRQLIAEVNRRSRQFNKRSAVVNTKQRDTKTRGVLSSGTSNERKIALGIERLAILEDYRQHLANAEWHIAQSTASEQQLQLDIWARMSHTSFTLEVNDAVPKADYPLDTEVDGTWSPRPISIHNACEPGEASWQFGISLQERRVRAIARLQGQPQLTLRGGAGVMDPPSDDGNDSDEFSDSVEDEEEDYVEAGKADEEEYHEGDAMEEESDFGSGEEEDDQQASAHSTNPNVDMGEPRWHPPAESSKSANLNAQKRQDLAKYLTEDSTVQKEFRAAELFDAQPAWEDFKKKDLGEGAGDWIRRHAGEGGHGRETHAKMSAVHSGPSDYEREVKSLEEAGKGGFLHMLGAEKDRDAEQNALMRHNRNEDARAAPSGDRTASVERETNEKSQEHRTSHRGTIDGARQVEAGSAYDAMTHSSNREQNLEALARYGSDVTAGKSARQQSGGSLSPPHSHGAEYPRRDRLGKYGPAFDKALSEFGQVSTTDCILSFPSIIRCLLCSADISI